MDGGEAVGPGPGLLELGGDPDEHVLPSVGGGHLHPDGEPLVIPAQRQGDGRLSGCVVHRVKGTMLAARKMAWSGLSGGCRNSPRGRGGSAMVGDSSRSKPLACHSPIRRAPPWSHSTAWSRFAPVWLRPISARAQVRGSTSSEVTGLPVLRLQRSSSQANPLAQKVRN